MPRFRFGLRLDDVGFAFGSCPVLTTLSIDRLPALIVLALGSTGGNPEPEALPLLWMLDTNCPLLWILEAVPLLCVVFPEKGGASGGREAEFNSSRLSMERCSTNLEMEIFSVVGLLLFGDNSCWPRKKLRRRGDLIRFNRAGAEFLIFVRSSKLTVARTGLALRQRRLVTSCLAPSMRSISSFASSTDRAVAKD